METWALSPHLFKLFRDRPREHLVQQRLRTPLLLDELLGALVDQRLEVVGVLLHHGQHVVKNVRLEALAEGPESAADHLEVGPHLRQFPPALSETRLDGVRTVEDVDARPETLRSLGAVKDSAQDFLRRQTAALSKWLRNRTDRRLAARGELGRALDRVHRISISIPILR